MAHVLTKKAAPPELVRLRLIRLYGAPSELGKVSLPRALEDLAVAGYEDEALGIQAKAKSKGKGR